MIDRPSSSPVPATNPVATKARVDWVDIAKGIAMILVVLYHVCLVLVAKDIAPAVWNELNGTLQPLRMPLFMLTSGLFAQKMIKMAWLPVLKTRVLLMIYLYLLWLFLFWAIHNLLPDDVRHKGYAKWSSVVNGTYWPQNALWYLYAIAIFIVAAKLISKLPVAAQLVLALAVSVGIQYETWMVFPYPNFFEYFLYFMIGLHLKDLVLDYGRRSSLLILVLGVAGYAGLLFLKNELHIPALKVAVSIVGVLAAISAAALLDGTKVGNLVNRVGQNTLPIFLMFDMLIALLTWPLLRLPEFPGEPLVLTVLVILAAMALHRILLRAHFTWLFELPKVRRSKRSGTVPAYAPPGQG